MGAALEQFKESYELANALKELERKHYSASPKIPEQPYVRGLRGGAAVLLVAAFEFYLRRLFEDNISTLNNVPVSIEFEKLPVALKVKAVFSSLENAMKGPPYVAKPPKVDRITHVLAACKLLINGHVDPESFTETGSNPNGDRVKEKFKEVGIADIFTQIKPAFEIKWKTPVSNEFIKATLDSIVLTRHVVAHTADTLKISRTSQNQSFKFIHILAELLEIELEKHMKKIKKDAKL
jgi:hypothetical protein